MPGRPGAVVLAASRSDSVRLYGQPAAPTGHERRGCCRKRLSDSRRTQTVDRRTDGGDGMKLALIAIVFFAALVVLWEVLVRAKIWSVVLVPSPVTVAEYFVAAARDGTLLQATGVTMKRLLMGYVLGLAMGLPLGLLTAR